VQYYISEHNKPTFLVYFARIIKKTNIKFSVFVYAGIPKNLVDLCFIL